MSVEVWAIKAAAGEAILRSARKWSLLALDSGWQTTPLPKGEEVLRWAQTGSPLPVGKSYRNLEEAIGDVREACLAVLAESFGSKSGDGAASRGPRGRQDHARSARNAFLARLLRHPRQGDRAGIFASIIEANCGRLERYFDSLGFSGTRSLPLIAEVFARLSESEGRWPGQLELDAELFRLAYEVYGELARPPARPRAGRMAVSVR